MKKRKPIIRNKKMRGEWAEMIFMVRATEHGLPVSKPWGEMRSYDFVVGWPGHFVAVQVKSTVFELNGGYVCSVNSHHKRYPPGSFDFLAAYVVFEDAWYIIPENEVQGMEKVSLHTGSNRANYEKYREAWHLLGRPKAGNKIDRIQACAELAFADPDCAELACADQDCAAEDSISSLVSVSDSDPAAMAEILRQAVRALGEDCLYSV